MTKRILSLMLVIISLLTLFSCGGEKYSYCEMLLPLGDEFYGVEVEDFDKAFSDGETVVAVLRISFVAANKEGFGEVLTPLEFGRFWNEKCERNADVLSGSGVFYSVYYNPSASGEDVYLEAFYRSKNAYFVLLFAAARVDGEEQVEKFLAYASGVRFTD